MADVTRRPSRPWRRVRSQIDAVDAATFAAVASTRSPLLDAVMPRLTWVADHGVLWMGIAAALAATRRPSLRRGALRGLVSLGVTSLVANQVSKRLSRRPRPSIDAVPVQRLARRIPRSTSFPSGHTASAAAFATGVGLEAPLVGVPLRGLAALVGFSRVATGAHYPSDVVAGWLLGSAVASLGARLVSPVRRGRVTLHRPIRNIGGRPTGAGVTLVVNPRSHSGRGARVVDEVRSRLPHARIVELHEHDDVAAVMTRAADGAEVLAVAGGDGTVRAAAAAALSAGIPLAVFPAGTFNHFAKDVGTFPLRRAIEAVRAGSATAVDVAWVNDGLFLNTASVGAYTDFVVLRERLERRVGKPVAALVAASRTLRRRKTIRVRVDDERPASVSLLFLGNNRHDPNGFSPVRRPRLDEGLVDLRTLEASRFVSRVKVLAALVTGQLDRNKRYRQSLDDGFEIRLLDGPARIARDGELGERSDHLRVRIDRRALLVVAPAARRP